MILWSMINPKKLYRFILHLYTSEAIEKYFKVYSSQNFLLKEVLYASKCRFHHL